MKKEQINKMRELKDFLEFKGEIVKNIKYIGTIDTNKKDKEVEKIEPEDEESEKHIFMCDIIIIDENKKEIHLIKYYTGELECVAIENEVNGMLPTEKYRETENVEKIKKLDKEGIIDLKKENDEEINKIIKILDLDKEKIKNISEINLEEKEIYNEKAKENDIEETEELKAKNLTSINANEKITTRDSMATLLGVEGKGYTKIAIVNSSEIKTGKNSTQYSFVGIKADGKMELIDSLEQVYGTTPTKTINAISPDGKNIQKETAYSMYRVKWREDEQLAVGIDDFNTIKVSYVRTSPETNQSVSIPIETNTIARNSGEIKEYMDPYKNPRVPKNNHQIIEGESVKDIKKDSEGEYIPNTDIKWETFAASCGYRGEGAIEKAKKEFEKAKELSSQEDNKSIAEEVVEQKEEEYSRNKEKI